MFTQPLDPPKKENFGCQRKLCLLKFVKKKKTNKCLFCNEMMKNTPLLCTTNKDPKLNSTENIGTRIIESAFFSEIFKQ